jgi:beta-lactam-binding protein with PASTA domain
MAAKDVVASALVAAVVSVGTSFGLARSNLLRQPADVPSVMGQPVESARASLEAKRLLLVVAQEREDAKAEPGQVVEQRPLAGSRIYRGESVAVVIAKAPTKAKMPSLVGQPVADARQRLEAMRVAVGKLTEEANDRIPAGGVISQSVAAEVEVLPGATVDLVVSKGGESLPVPSVIGRSLNRAKEQLQKAGFTVGNVKYRVDEDQEEWVVLQQTPPANQPAPKGSAVELVVNRTE